MLLTSGSQNGDRSSSRGNGTGSLILRRRPLRPCWKRFRCSISASGALRTTTQFSTDIANRYEEQHRPKAWQSERCCTGDTYTVKRESDLDLTARQLMDAGDITLATGICQKLKCGVKLVYGHRQGMP